MAEGEAAAVKGTQFLGQKIGPMPAGAWLAVIGGGLAIGFVMRRKPAPAPVPVGDSDRQVGEGVYGALVPSTTDASGYTQKYGTNGEWIRAALGNLIGRGFVADRVTNALNRIFYPSDQNRPTPEDAAIYNAAVAAVGAPPTLPTAYVPDAPSGQPTMTDTYAARTRAWRGPGGAVSRFTWQTVEEAKAFTIPKGSTEVPYQSLAESENKAILKAAGYA